MSRNEEIKKLRALKTIQWDSIDGDRYMQGMFNGLELAIAILEDRTPYFIDKYGNYNDEEVYANPEEIIKGNILLKRK